MQYILTTQHNEKAMRLQNIGWVIGTPAGELKEGDFIMWNFGTVYGVAEITAETEKTITISTYNRSNPSKLYSQRLAKRRLICILTH